MDISITIIIPVYNVEKYLEQCLESVVNQSVPFDEVILVNDGSIDNSLSICEHYSSSYGYFKLINQENKGPSAARNVGMKCASSEYIMFLDSDDYLCTDTLKILKEELKKSKQDAILFDAKIHCEDGIVSRDNYDRSNAHLDGIEMNGWEYFLLSYPINYIVSPCFAIYRKKIIDNICLQFPEGMYYEDNYFWFVFIIHAKRVIHISKMLYQRRCRKDSITTGRYSERKFADYIKVTLLIWKEIFERKESLSEKQKETLLEFINDYCKMILKNYILCEEQEIELTADSKELFRYMTEQYELLLDSLYLKSEFLTFHRLKKILENMDYIYRWCKENRTDTKKMIHEIVKRQKLFYHNMMKSLPLNIENIKIGIYGTGKHTEGLLAIYNKMFGKIVSNVVFLDSYNDNVKFKEKDVINYRRIDNSFHEIIISSFLYEQQMMKNIRSINKKIKVHTFYNTLKLDVFSDCELFLKYYSF